MSRSNLLYTTRASATQPDMESKKSDDMDTPVQIPDTFGFALLSSPIRDGAVDLIWMFLNRTEKVQLVQWTNTHPFDVVIEYTGGSLRLNDYMPSPGPPPPATEVLAGTENYRVMHFDPTNKEDWPTLNFCFDPVNAPYRIHLKLQSPSHVLEASADLRFSD